MRKTAAFFLLCTYLLLQAASVCWYFYKPLAHAYFLELSKTGSDKDLVSISIDQNQLDELKNEEDEIVIDGVLYDVESSVTSGNRITLLLKKDIKESNWDIHYKKMANLLHKHAAGKHAGSGKIPFSLIPLFFCKETNTNPCFIKYLHNLTLQLSADFYSGPVKELVTPPPRSC